VKVQAFLCTNFPAELSVDREAYCSPARGAEQDTAKMRRPRTYVSLLAGRVRREVDLSSVLAKPIHEEPSNLAHAEIHLSYGGAVERYETKGALLSALLWNEHTQRCEKLCEIARIRDEDRQAS
jgi:hypothetical protein